MAKGKKKVKTPASPAASKKPSTGSKVEKAKDESTPAQAGKSNEAKTPNIADLCNFAAQKLHTYRRKLTERLMAKYVIKRDGKECTFDEVFARVKLTDIAAMTKACDKWTFTHYTVEDKPDEA
jgi:hypothetical protein